MRSGQQRERGPLFAAANNTSLYATLTAASCVTSAAAPNVWAKALQPYLTGGGSAIFASICVSARLERSGAHFSLTPRIPQVHPMDLTKTRMQLLPKGASLFTVAGDILTKDGVKGLYAGCVQSGGSQTALAPHPVRHASPPPPPHAQPVRLHHAPGRVRHRPSGLAPRVQ